MKRQEIKKNYKRTKIKVEKKWHCHGNNPIHSKENQTILLVGCKKRKYFNFKVCTLLMYGLLCKVLKYFF